MGPMEGQADPEPLNADKETQTLEESLAEHHAWQMVWASEQKQGNANEKGTALR